MEREAGFLTEGYREFLTESAWEERTSGEYSTKRSRIRSKIQGAVLDFSLLLEELPAAERQQAFAGEDAAHPAKPGREPGAGSYGLGFRGGMVGESFEFVKGEEQLVDSIADTVTFLWLSCWDAQVDPADLFSQAIAEAHTDDVGVDVSAVHDADRGETLAARGRRKMARGDDLEDPEASALVRLDEEIVPDGLVFDYLRGEVDEYELPPFSWESRSKD